MPSAPNALKVLRVTGDSVTLQWSAPYSDGGMEITRYVVLQKEESTSTTKSTVSSLRDDWEEVAKVPSSTTSHTVKKLREGRHYHFAIYAMNRTGKGSTIETSRPVSPRKASGKCRLSGAIKIMHPYTRGYSF